MSFREFVAEAQDLTRLALQELGYPIPENLDWDEPPDLNLGDLSLRVGYQLAKSLSKRPFEIASSISSKISSGERRKLVDSVEAHPSGFLNFKIKKDIFQSKVLGDSLQPEYGKIDIGQGEVVLLEHTAVNPNKALHIGHLRNVTLGDSIGKILHFSGYKVQVINYIDDSGGQVADVIVGMRYLDYTVEAPQGVKYDHYAGDEVYVGVNKRYEIEPALKEKQKFVLRAIEEKDSELFPFVAMITDRILREQLATCWRLGIFYDAMVYESDIIQSKLWETVFSEIQSKGIARLETEGKYQGCFVVSVPGEMEGEDKVLVRGDGTATYIAKDLPFAGLKVGVVKDRFRYLNYVTQPNGRKLWRSSSANGEPQSPISWGSGKSITVIDSRQARLQRIIKYILESLAGKSLTTRFIHLGYAIISLSANTANMLASAGEQSEKKQGVVTMSGRRGTYVNVDDLLEEVKKKALSETRKRNENETNDSWFDIVSEKLAIAAIKFSVLKQDLDKMIVFDMEDSLQLIGETGPYMLYTYARATSIKSKARSVSSGIADGKFLSSESEVALLKLISKFDIYIEKSVIMLAPKWIAHYSFELSEAFNKFYEKNRVNQEENPDLRASRLALVDSFRITLEKSLGLLGIETLERI